MIDYRRYQFRPFQIPLLFIGSFVLFFVISFFMMRFLPFAIFMGILGAFLLPRLLRSSLQRRRLHRLRNEFKDFLHMLIPLLEGGRSIENGILAIEADLDRQNFPILQKELFYFRKGLQNHVTIEQLVEQFARRSGLSDVMDFSEVLKICKRSTGNITEIVRSSVGLIEEKIEIEEELHVILAKKQLEQRLLLSAPFFIVLMLTLIAPDYLSVLYSCLLGNLVMLLALLLIAFSLILSLRFSRVHYGSKSPDS